MENNNKHLVRVGHEFAAAMSDDTPIITIAKMVTTLASALDEQTARSEALEAENSTIKTMNDCLSEELRGYESDGAFDGPNMHLLWWKTETPATDAFLTETRAQGVEMLGEAAERLMDEFGDDSYKVMVTADLQRLANAFAAQLRGNSTGGAL